MYKYHCLNPISRVGIERFSEDYEAIDSISGADAVLVRSADMHETELPDSLKAIGRAGAGVNNIPLDECSEKGIVVFNTPGANANGVKELVIAGMLLASRDIVDGINWVQTAKDEEDLPKLAEKQKKAYAGCEIEGKKLGVIGLGAIGVLVANTAVHLGMEVYGYDPYISVDAAWRLSRSIQHIQDVSLIFKECDYITIHVPLNDGTKKMINQEALSQMKDGVVVLNFARGPLVDEEAMLEALESGKVRRYVTDFPNKLNANAKGALVIPHLGASTEESEDNCAKMAVKELRDYLENGNITNSVNYPSCDMGRRRYPARICIHHKNIPNMIGQFTTLLAGDGVNIADMVNKSKNVYAYTVIDTEMDIVKKVVEELSAIDGVLRVRVIRRER